MSKGLAARAMLQRLYFYLFLYLYTRCFILVESPNHAAVGEEQRARALSVSYAHPPLTHTPLQVARQESALARQIGCPSNK